MNEVKISRQEIISLCRLCLAKDLASIDIFEDGNELRHLYTKIVACLPVQVFANDTLPHKICEVCNAKVDDFYQFWTSTAKNQKQLNDWLQVATDQKVDHASVAVPRIKVEAEERDDYEDYDDGVRADDSDDDEEEASAPKRIKTTHSDTEEDTKPTDLVSSLPDSSDVNGKKKSKEHKWLLSDWPITSTNPTYESDEPYKYVCETCGKNFKFKQSLTRHNERKHDVVYTKEEIELPLDVYKYKCEMCGKRFKFKQSCERHYDRKHFSPQIFKCKTCKEEFPTPEKLENHVDKAHPLVDSSVPQKKSKNEPMSLGDYTLEQWNALVASKAKDCPVCHKSYTEPRNMRRHLREMHSSQKAYICDVCGKEFAFKNNLSRHKREHQKGYVKVVVRKYECDICKLKFRTKFHITEHMTTHTGYKAYECEECKKTFSYLKCYKLHLKRHQQSAEVFPCSICDKIFYEKHRLRIHLNWVHGDSCHICNICGKKIKSLCLNSHMRKHTGEKYECPYCKKLIASQYAYKLHVKKHEYTLHEYMNL